MSGGQFIFIHGTLLFMATNFLLISCS